jgi:hypothetical protein
LASASLIGFGAELGEQEGAAFGQEVHVVVSEVLATHEVEEHCVHALKANGAEADDVGDGVGGEERVGEGEHREAAAGRRVHQVQRGGEDGGECAFRTDDGAGHLEAALGEKFVEVVAGDAARDLREAAADLVDIAVADTAQASVNLSRTTAAGDDGRNLVVGGGADGHAGAVVEEDVEGADVVGGKAAHDAVRAAGVVADHTADGAAGVGGGIGREGEVMHFGGLADAIENDARLDDGGLRFGIEGEDAPHVFGEVEDNGDVATLAREAGSGAARQDGRAERATGGDGGFHVGGIAGQHDADGGGAVVGGVDRVEGAGGRIEADFTLNGGAESGFELARCGEGFVGARLVEDGKLGRHQSSLRRKAISRASVWRRTGFWL